jgi:hypothetical protein
MHQSSTLDVGLDVHKESSAVAYVATAHHAAVVSLGNRGPPANVRAINSSVSGRPTVRLSSLSMTPALAGIGSIAL